MTVVVTGAKGQLGNAILTAIKDGKTVIGTIPKVYENCTVIAVDVDELDITDRSCVERFFHEHKPNLVINCAAMTNVDAAEQQIDLAFKINALGVKYLAVACEAVGAKLVHLSTDYVFKGDTPALYSEWDRCDPPSVYGKSKLLGEVYAREYCKSTFIVRTAWLYGRVGNNFLKTILNLAASRDTIQVVDDQMGTPTNAEDLAHELLEIAATDNFGIYHCTGNGECSWYDFAKRIVELSKLNCTVNACTTEEFNRISSRPAKRPEHATLDNMMLRCTIGDKMRDWDAALIDYMK